MFYESLFLKIRYFRLSLSHNNLRTDNMPASQTQASWRRTGCIYLMLLLLLPLSVKKLLNYVIIQRNLTVIHCVKLIRKVLLTFKPNMCAKHKLLRNISVNIFCLAYSESTVTYFMSNISSHWYLDQKSPAVFRTFLIKLKRWTVFIGRSSPSKICINKKWHCWCWIVLHVFIIV